MIREQEAITYFEDRKKELEYFRKIYPSPNTVGYQATTKEISFYEMAISALENKSEWIPVSSGELPKEIKTKGHGLCHVLVTHKYAGITRTHQAVFDQGKFLDLEDYKEDNTVIAWRPLPEPYKADMRGEE